MILLIDNYDSFSHNLYHLIGAVNPDIKIVRNDTVTVEEIRALAPSHIVISPGPGKPADAGICIEAIKRLYTETPILGICLGHQAIYEAFGGTVGYAAKLMHGKASKMMLTTTSPLFAGMPFVIDGGRYHSLVAMKDTLPDALKVIAWTEDGEIMAIAHKQHPVYGVQFHPESILTPQGKSIIENFLA